MLYLIDTSAGEENILNTYDEIEKYDRAAVKAVLNEDTVGFKTVATIMTYAKFGYLIKQDALDLKTFGLIVCDELQSLMSYMEWSEKPLKKAYPFATDEDRLEFLTKSSLPHIAFHTLVRILDDAEQEIFIIALSATPRMILANINNHIMINLKADINKLKQKSTVKYPTIEDIPYLISKTGKTLIYIPKIASMNKAYTKISNLGVKCERIWSTNSNIIMSDEQNNVREFVLKTGELPNDITVLIINAAYQTSININDELIDTVIVHSTEEDEIVQARGRVRHNIDTFYIFEPRSSIVRPIPDRFIGHFLTKEEKNEICEYLNIKDAKGQLRKFPYIVNHLSKRMYNIQNRRSKYIIHKR